MEFTMQDWVKNGAPSSPLFSHNIQHPRENIIYDYFGCRAEIFLVLLVVIYKLNQTLENASSQALGFVVDIICFLTLSEPIKDVNKLYCRLGG